MDNYDLLDLLRRMVECNASDLYLTTGAPPQVKVDGVVQALPFATLVPGQVHKLAYSAMGPAAIDEYERTMECNMSYSPQGIGRFRVNIYQQRREAGMVIRLVRSDIPEFESLGLPSGMRELAMRQRGLILIIGSAGSGKTTTLASMVDYRAQHQSGHILTVEDPIEYLFRHGLSTVDQREVGIDTLSFSNALRNAMRQAPDVILIGEIRDRETMEHALAYAETGHLCVSTLHASNASQAVKRILNFFPDSAHAQLRMDLSLNLQAIVAQRLLPGVDGRRVLATEMLLQSAHVSDLILRGAVDELRQSLEKTSVIGTHSFDQSLLDLYQRGLIEQEVALSNADSRTDLGLRMRLRSSHDPH
ncbi:PilT/PilU family type 4a pilus ATPase [Candidatus Aalborgicola defluviihabitans]|uniref:PilT/PilU family type 4a pilus ATPase n=1 Tax=Candidatus Aalborgicola defluviihabitans TaxID=3386187 RepID=UPI001ECF64F8|nr:PilT/PilU family type 4a pilus ATPase [Burkholderiales bacterium]